MAFLLFVTLLLLLNTCFCSKYEIFTHSPNAVNRHDINDCAGLQDMYPESTSGVYTINPSDKKGPLTVSCDMTSYGGGWTVIQRRMDGSVNFTRNFWDYKVGFGNLSDEFYLGNELIHRITGKKQQKLLFILEDFDGTTKFALYSDFYISNETDFYRLQVGGYNGTAGDSFTFHNGQQFSTFDSDHDGDPNWSCRNLCMGGWWYRSHEIASLNGEYNSTDPIQGVVWKSFKGTHNYSLKSSKIMIKPME